MSSWKVPALKLCPILFLFLFPEAVGASQPKLFDESVQKEFRITKYPKYSYRRRLQIYDLKSGQTIETTYSLVGSIQEELIRDSNGSLIEQWVQSQNLLVHEVFNPNYRKDELRFHGNRVTSTTVTRADGQSQRTWVNSATTKNALQVCQGPPLSESLVSSIEGELTEVLPAVSDFISWAANHGHVGSVREYGCDSRYPGGATQLWQDLREGVAQGISCLARQGNASRRDAARLIALLDTNFGRPLSIHCERLAVASQGIQRGWAHVLGDADFPAISLDFASSTPGTSGPPRLPRPELIFHELLHLLGYAHGENFDLPYAAQACCFRFNGRESSRVAGCQLLSERPDWRSARYLDLLENLQRGGSATGRPSEELGSSSNFSQTFMNAIMNLSHEDSVTSRRETALAGAEAIEAIFSRYESAPLDSGARVAELVAMGRAILPDLSPTDRARLTASIHHIRSGDYRSWPIPSDIVTLSDEIGGLLSVLRTHQFENLTQVWESLIPKLARACSREDLSAGPVGEIARALAPTIEYYLAWNHNPEYERPLRQISERVDRGTFCPRRP